jgi:PKD repeat protein
MRDHWRIVLLASVLALGSAAPFMAHEAESAPMATLSSDAANRAISVSAPTIDAPASVTAFTDQSESITATASDPDAGDVLTITATGAPASLVFSHVPSTSPASATLSGALGSGDVGSFTIDWSVSDGTFTENTSTALSVSENRPPMLDAPATFPGAVSVEMSFPVLASDPDGDTIHSLTASGVPAGASFTPNGLLTSGEFAWTPALGQEGDYAVTFTIASGSPERSSSVTTMIHIGPQDLPPIVTAPATVQARANHFLSFTATASDPLGEAITSFSVNGAQNTPLPAGSLFTVNASHTSGTFTWTPTADQVGTVSLRWHATDAEPFPLSTGPEQFTTKVVVSPDRAPVITVPATVSGTEGAALTVNVSVADPDGDAISSLSASGLPFGATFAQNAAHTTGTLNWTPDFTQSGTYPILFTASNLVTGTANCAITIANVNRMPAANPGGPYSGVATIPLSFDGSGSSDPDGNALAYAWDFGDGGSATGAMPNHSYAAGGAYTVSLTVTDNGSPALSNSAATTATIAAVFDANVFTRNQYRSIKLASNKPEWAVQIEPMGGNFNLDDLDLATVVLEYGAGEIHAASGKSNVVSDTDHDGVEELAAVFAKDDLRTLFAGLPNGSSTVTVTVEGTLSNGALVRGSTQVQVVASGGALLASVAPNPFNPETKLSFVTKKPGALRVQIYDVNGRLVRTLADEANSNPGNHEIHIDGRANDGTRLASGTYFFRIEAVDGETTGRISILK